MLTDGVLGLVLVVSFQTASSLTSLTTLSISRLALFYLMPKKCCMVCLNALSLDQSYSYYILLPSAKLFKIIVLVYVSTFMPMTHSYTFNYLGDKNYLDDTKKWPPANKLKLYPNKMECKLQIII